MKTLFMRKWWQTLWQAKPARPLPGQRTRRTALLVEALEDRTLPSGTPQMLVDVNHNTFGSNPTDLVAIGSSVFFSADGGTHGYGLWKSDGTAAGTTLLLGIHSTSAEPNPTNLTNVNGTLYFTSGMELWKSDGTAAGTVMVKELDPTGPIYFGSYPQNLTNVTGILYFAASDGVHGNELWKSDGTAAGTVVVKDIDPGSRSSYPILLTNVNATLFFTASDGASVAELWKSDGTAAGTVLVKDVYPGTNFSYLGHLTDVKLTGGSDTLFFAASDGVHGDELWKSDGTTAGTVMLKDIDPGSGSSYPRGLTDLNGTLYFDATGATPGNQLWKSNGTAAGTTLVTSVASMSSYSMTSVNGTLYFTGDSPTAQSALWKSNGTAAGTIPLGSSRLPFGPVTGANGSVFFSGFDTSNGQELWKSDGTVAGTVLVKDIKSGSNGSYPASLVNANGTLFFAAHDGTHGTELWKSDGSSAGTVLVKDINTNSTAGPLHASDFTSVGGMTFFVANDGVGHGLWQTNGTTAGTALVKEFDVADGSYPSYLTNLNGTLFFADSGALWKSDGTASGTTVVETFNQTPTDLTNVNGTLFLEDDGWLYRSDGTPAGTTPIAQIFGTNLTNANGMLLFTGEDGNGTELWRSDGTTAGTTLVNDLYPGGSGQNVYYPGDPPYIEPYYRYVYTPNGSNPRDLTMVGGTTFFVADDATGTGLWKTDGTAAGTTLVEDFAVPSSLTDVNGTLFFGNSSGLWKSDGTATGTTAVSSVGVYSPLIDVNGTLFFAGNDGIHGTELWKSDGPAAGTMMVTDINPGSAGSNPASLTNVNGTLYFAANDGSTGVELWQSDGTAAGTVRVMDINPGSAGSYPANLANSNGTLYFRADDGVHGSQPWVLPATPTPPAAASLAISAFPSSSMAGVPGSFTVTAENTNGTPATGYAGTVYFTSSDGQAWLPANYTFTAADAGLHTFTAALKTAGTQSLTATDTTSGSVTGSQTGISVLPTTASRLVFAQQPSTTTAGQAISPAVTVDVKDQYGNQVTADSSTVTLTLSSGTFEGGSATFAAVASGGVATFSALKIDTASSYTLQATDGSLTPAISSSFTVSAAAASTMIVTGFPSPTTAGVVGTVTVTLKDVYGNIASGYTGTVHFTSSDARAALPANYTFSGGSHTFSVTLKTAGTQSITVTDTTTGSLTGTDAGITVSPAAASQFLLSVPVSVPAGATFSLTLTVEDAFGNVVTGYTGTVHFSSSDGKATLPANYTFTAADKGVHTFTGLVLRKRGHQKITMTDTLNSALTGSATVDVL
jgi:ELWxxDGT repeat protein